MHNKLRLLPLIFCFCAPSGFASATATIESTPLKQYDHTTRYQTEDVQWSPSSVTVINGEEIESTFRRTLEDLDGYVPGLVIDPISGTPQGAAIGLRGIHSTNTSSGFEPAVAVTVDGVYVGTHAAQNQHLFDLEAVEVARGPQGTFTAAPAEGGAVHLLRTLPTGELGLKTRLSAGDFNGNNLDAVLNFGITESLAAKFSIAYQNRDGADLKNVISDRRENGIDRTSYALSLLWELDNGWRSHYTFDLDRDDSDVPGLLNLSQPTELVCDPTAMPANCASSLELRLPESNNRQRFLQNFSNEREYETDAHTLRIDGDFLGHTLTSITGFRQTKETSNQDLDGTFTDKHSRLNDTNYQQISTDLRIQGRYSDNLTYSLGAYYFQSEYDTNESHFFVLDLLDNAGRTAHHCFQIKRAHS